MLLIELSETGVSEKDLWGVGDRRVLPTVEQPAAGRRGEGSSLPSATGETGEEGEGSQYIDRHLLPFLPNSPVACV